MSEIKVPELGESVTEATVGTWHKKEGDSVSRDEVLVELETDKVSLEVTANEDGVLSSITVAEGGTVEPGAVLGMLGTGSGSGSSAAKASGETAANDDLPDHGGPGESTGAGSSGGGGTEVTVPAMGESVSEGTIGTLLVKAGDAVSKDTIVAEIETDKVALEVPAGADGTLSEWLVAEGDTVTPGAAIARVSGAGAAASSGTGSGTDAAAKATNAAAQSVRKEARVSQGAVHGDTAAETGVSMSGRDDRPVSPSVRRISAEAGVNPSAIPGTGPDGRATKGDALAYVRQLESGQRPQPAAERPKPAPSAPRELGPREERVRMTRLRQTIARRLKEAQETAAMLTTFNDVDMGEIMDLRKQYKESFLDKHGVKLGFMGFFVKACVSALKEIPAVNAEIDGTDIIYKNHYDVGVAVGTEKGLVVPVVRDADTLSLAGIERAIGELGVKARDGDLTIADMQGGTFTISNGGVYGSLMSTPILNPPQSGVLGMHRIEQRPVAVDGKVEIRPMMYLALSYDHRIVDGKEAVTFLVRVKEALEDPERMLLDI